MGDWQLKTVSQDTYMYQYVDSISLVPTLSDGFWTPHKLVSWIESRET